MAGIFDRFRFSKREGDDDTESTRNISTTVAGPAKRRKNIHNELESEIGAQRSHKWQERWHAICDDCFKQVRPCKHYSERRLRLLIVGHNPSDHAWRTGYSYSNPTNRMWMLLTGTMSPYSWEGIIPSSAKIRYTNNNPEMMLQSSAKQQ
ncbi:Uracil-DNA glycosylase-like [Plasmopara halstedii]|uniref:Uracil-DNA glycosylase-like n=1 Tax=Plasmopara halstedii TaxID=4781 RepID=A0A0P1AWA6_PLAHL|nr:Uracil-DNA glycosylase-like [Plasmopara halstedii]CEG45810.1 Uracil-DNA glycosylase-like [Plasmopara halstedii]|eukprot:XP_024582179.1 Uracil-DNA glycosylase-like [Plasmopara halstedii]